MLKPSCLLAGSSSLILGSMLLTATPAESRSVVIHRVIVGDRTPNVIVIKKGSGFHHHYPRWNHGYLHRQPSYEAVIPGVGSVVTSPWGNPYSTHSPWGQPWSQPYGGYAYPSVGQPAFGTPVFVYPSQHPRRRVRGSVTISF
jgi:hypothetical protein